MIQNDVTEEILKFHRRNVIYNGLILLIEAAFAHIIEEKTGIISMWWYILTIGIGIVINLIMANIFSHKIRKHLSQIIQEENYELTTMIVERGIVNPSHIKPLLESIASADEEEDE